MAYTTPEDVALFLNIATLNSMESQLVDQLIAYVGGVIDSYCGYCLEAKDYTDKRFNGSGTDSLDLGLFPINAVVEVKEKTSDGTFTDLTASVEGLADGTLRFLPEVGGTFTSGTANIYVSFNGGMATIPQELAFAATYLAAIYFNKSTWDLIGIKSQGATNGSTEYDSIELPLLVKRVLDRYRKVSIY